MLIELLLFGYIVGYFIAVGISLGASSDENRMSTNILHSLLMGLFSWILVGIAISEGLNTLNSIEEIQDGQYSEKEFIDSN